MTGSGSPILYQNSRIALWYPYLVENGEISFTVCKGQTGSISYVARVVSAGTYTAEAPLIQHEQYPSVAAVGQDQVITVK